MPGVMAACILSRKPALAFNGCGKPPRVLRIRSYVSDYTEQTSNTTASTRRSRNNIWGTVRVACYRSERVSKSIPANMDSSGNKRSTSQTRNRPSSRPTTPLRPSSSTSLRDGQGFITGDASSEFPLEALEPAFAELSDSMADLEANFMHLQLMHESLSRFNESFASFLYGLNMNAFCVDFPEVRTYKGRKSRQLLRQARLQ